MFILRVTFSVILSKLNNMAFSFLLVPTTPVPTSKPTVPFITGNQFTSFKLNQTESQLY